MQRLKKARRCFAVFLFFLAMLVGMLPVYATETDSTVLAKGTFGEEDNLTWVLENTGLLVISGTGKMQDAYVQDYPWYEFADKVTAVRVEDGVENIGTYMFEEYDSLETVELSDSVAHIGKYSFNYCDKLRSVTIPKMLKTVEEQAFYCCPLLSDVHITDVQSWFGIAFASAHANPLYNGADLFQDGNILTAITVPEDVTAIGKNQFYGCQSLVRINLHANVTAIGADAFGNCPSLRAICCEKADDQIQKILDGNSDLNKELFVCPSDGEDNITDGDVIEKDGVLYNTDRTKLLGVIDDIAATIVVPETVSQITAGAFRNCFSLQEITLPDAVTELPDALFENCRNLRRVSFSENLTAIGDRTFSGCIRMEEIILPETVTQVGEYAFFSCRALCTVTLPSAITDLANGVLADCARLEEIKLPEELQTVGNNAFYNCYSLKEVILPKAVTKIGTSVFNGCAALTEMILPDGITDLPEQVFYGCYNLKEVVFPSALTGIGRYAFYDCISLGSLRLPDTLEKIGEYAFHGCETLTEVVLPTAVSQLEDGTFMACLRLSRLTLSEKMQSIGKYAFGYCQTMSALYIPASVANIDADAFFRCSALKEIYFAGTKEQWIGIYAGDMSNVSIYSEHTHTAGKWYVTAYSQPDRDGQAVSNCLQCFAVSTDVIPMNPFKSGKKAAVDHDGRISAVASLSVSEILQAAGEGAVLTDANGEAVEESVFVATGMLLTLADGTRYELLVLGDVSGDGQIMAEDARFVLRLSVGLETAENGSALYRACDVDDIPGVSSSDARSILRVAVGLDSENDWKR